MSLNQEYLVHNALANHIWETPYMLRQYILRNWHFGPKANPNLGPKSELVWLKGLNGPKLVFRTQT